ncbi:MAG: hypothetical protein ACON39_09335 [Coraliomargaritaceae bacterium]
MAKKTTKPAAKKTVTKTASKKAVTATKKKAVTKKTAVKKAAPAKKTAPKKKSAAKKVAKKAPAKKKSGKALVQTRVVARVDVGFGNALYIRGEGAGLSWEKGALMENISPYEWAFSTTRAKAPIEFKCLINDQVWAEGNNQTVPAGGSSISSPVFHW